MSAYLFNPPHLISGRIYHELINPYSLLVTLPTTRSNINTLQAALTDRVNVNFFHCANYILFFHKRDGTCLLRGTT